MPQFLTALVLLGALSFYWLAPSGEGDLNAAPALSKADYSMGSAQFCEKWSEQACSTAMLRACALSDHNSCLSTQDAFCSKLISGSRFSQEDATACLNSLENAFSNASFSAKERELLSQFGGSCAKLLKNRASEGESCKHDDQCEADLGCARVQGSSLASCQKIHLVKQGESCSEASNRCEEGMVCSKGSCGTGAKQGEPCDPLAPCSEENYCQLSQSGRTGECKSKLDIGGQCQSDQACHSGTCARTWTRAPGICVESIALVPQDPLCSSFR